MKEYFAQAMVTPCGIAINTDDVPATIQKLHAVRRELADPALRQIIISPSRENPSTQVFLMKKPEPNEVPDGGEA